MKPKRFRWYDADYAERVAQGVRILFAFALERPRESMTYAGMAVRYGLPPNAAITMGQYLGGIAEVCAAFNWPRLNAKVVRKDSGEPGAGVVTAPGRSPRAERQAVAQFRWKHFIPPSTARVRKILGLGDTP